MMESQRASRSRRARAALVVIGLLLGLLTACAGDPPGAGDIVITTPIPSPRSVLARRPAPEPALVPCDGPPSYTAAASVGDWPPFERAPLVRDDGLQTLLDSLIPSDGRASAAVVDISMGRYAAVNSQQVWYPASLYKVPLLVEALWQEEHGILDPARRLTVGDRYASADLGTMGLLGLDRCAETTIAGAVEGMTIASDNASAHLVRDLVGADHVDRHLETLGLRQTSVDDSRLSTTAFDMARLLGAITRGYPSTFVSEAAQRLLLNQWVRDRIPAGIDDAEATVGNKTGDWDGAAHDVAIVQNPLGSYVIVILTDGSLPTEFFTGLSRAVYAHLNTAWTEPP